MLHLPLNPKEWFCFIFFWIGVLWTMIYECCIVVWHYHQEWNIVVKFQIILAAVLIILIYTNMYFLITTDVSVKTVRDKFSANMADCKYCDICKGYAPPRSHHCKICDTCILKRDHHCWFAGYCIGFNNQRYLISLAFYTCIAGVYCNIYNWQFVISQKGGFGWTTIPSLFAPHVGLVFGYYTLLEFAFTANTSLGLFFTIFFIWLLENQVVQIMSGQVMYERKKGIHKYDLGLANSINEVFGSAGLFALLCPYLPSKLAGDGTHFPQRDGKSK